MNICIVGLGYIGLALADYLSSQGHSITGTTRNASRLETLSNTCNHIVLLEKPSDLEKAFQNQEIVIITVAPDRYQLKDYEETYLETAKTIVGSLPSSVKQIIYTSSTSVYGNCNGDWVEETRPLAPTSPQADILCQTEQVYQQSKTPACILRLGEIYGPAREFLDKLRTMSQPRPGDGSNFMNIIHRDDIIKAIDFAIENNLDGVFNLCEERHPTRKAFYDQLCHDANLPPITWDPSIKSVHGGSKRINSRKIRDAGLAVE